MRLGPLRAIRIIGLALLLSTRLLPQTTLNGVRVPQATGIATLGTSGITSGACASVVTVAATGAFPASCSGGALRPDIISWEPSADITAITGYAPATTGGLAIYPYGSAGNVNFKVCNPTSSTITPGSAVTLNWAVFVGSCVVAVSPASAGPYTAGQTVSSPTFTCPGCSAATWSINSAGTSAGLTINSSTGAMGGTAASAGSYTNVVVSYGSVSTPAFTVTVNAVPSITACGSGSVSGGAATCNPGTAGTAYSESVTSTGGTGTITYSITSGGSTLTALSLSMASNGTISGTPTAGTATFTVVATDANGVASSGVVMTLVVSAGSSITYISSASKGAASGSVALTVSGATSFAGGNFIAVCASGVPSSGASVGDTVNTYTASSVLHVSTVYIQAFYAQNATTSSSMTLTLSGTSMANASMVAAAFSGVATSSALDTGAGTQTGTSASTTTVQPSSALVPSNADELLIQCLGGAGNATQYPWTIDSSMITNYSATGVTLQQDYVSGVNYGSGMAYQIQTTITSRQPTWTSNGGNTGSNGTILWAFLQ
jgi:large repetitive protein